MKKVFVFSLAFLSASSIFAADNGSSNKIWVDEQGYTCFQINRGNIASECVNFKATKSAIIGGVQSKLVWTKVNYNSSQTTETGKIYQSVTNYLQIDCANELARVKQSLFYDAAGNSVGSYSNSSSEMSPIPPGTALADVEAYVCKS